MGGYKVSSLIPCIFRKSCENKRKKGQVYHQKGTGQTSIGDVAEFNFTTSPIKRLYQAFIFSIKRRWHFLPLPESPIKTILIFKPHIFIYLAISRISISLYLSRRCAAAMRHSIIYSCIFSPYTVWICGSYEIYCFQIVWREYPMSDFHGNVLWYIPAVVWFRPALLLWNFV